MSAEIYRLGFDRCQRGAATVVFKHRADGVIEMVADYWKPACDFADRTRPNPPFTDRVETDGNPDAL